MVEQATASAGTIQGTDEEDVQPNQNRPAGRRMDSTQTKRRRPSGVEEALPKRSAILSCQMEMINAMMDPMHIAVEAESVVWRVDANAAHKQVGTHLQIRRRLAPR